MNLSKEFKGWNSKNLKDKSEALQDFLIKHYLEMGHAGLDEVCIKLFDAYHYDEEEEQ